MISHNKKQSERIEIVVARPGIAQVSKEAKIELDEEEYIGKFKPFMMDVVFEWCKGAKFSQICKMTELFEGTRTLLMCTMDFIFQRAANYFIRKCFCQR